MDFVQDLLRHQFYRIFGMADHEMDKKIELKKLLKDLEAARASSNSMVISLVIPPYDQISRVTKMLEGESGAASNIRSDAKRQSIVDAIASVQHRLISYDKVPPNGLVIYTGTVLTDDGKEKKVTVEYEPYKPIDAFYYIFDKKFHTEELNRLVESD